MAEGSIQITDYSNEKSSFRVTSPNLTAGNFDTQAGLAATLASTTQALSIGHLSKQTIAAVLVDDPDLPTNVYAQRESKWLVTYRGATSGKIYQIEIPAPDLTDNVVPNTDVADLTSTDWLAWIAAFEAFARTPDNPSALVEVVSAKHVGRNL